MLELETWLELELETFELELELRLELEIWLDELLLELLLLLEDMDELLITISELLGTDEEDGTTTGRLELLIAADEDTTDDELEGGFSGA